jgi:HipA-like protein
MREAKVLFKDEEAGVITQHDDGSYTFRYYDVWLADKDKPGISLTLPKMNSSFIQNIYSLFFIICYLRAQISKWYVN